MRRQISIEVGTDILDGAARYVTEDIKRVGVLRMFIRDGLAVAEVMGGPGKAREMIAEFTAARAGKS